MSETGTSIALISDKEERAVWEPIFTRLEQKTLLVEMMDILSVVKELRENRESVSLVIISTRVYPFVHPKLVSQARLLFPDANIMLMCLSTDPPPPLSPLLADNVSHLLINPVGGPSSDLNKVVSIFDLSIRRLKNGLPISMADYIEPGTLVHEYRVSSSEQKEELIAELERTIGGYSQEFEMLRMKGALLADEMLENAFYGAPRGKHSEPLYRKGEKRELAVGENIMFRYGFDGETLALEVTDGWGTLTSEDFFRHLTQHFDKLGVHEEIGGRGLFIVWRFLDTLLIRIDPGKKTVIGGQVRLSKSEYLPEIKGFHITSGP